MDKQNISVLDILKQVQANQNENLAELKQIDSQLLAVEIKENPLLQEIFDEIAKESTAFAETLGEINEQLNG